MRPRKPREEKRLRGTLRKSRENVVNLPTSPRLAGPLVKPAHLKGRASELFHEYAKAAPWLDGLQSALLAVMCQLLAEAERDPTIMTPARLAQLRGLRADLGFVAAAKYAARAHAEAAPPEDDDPPDPAERFFDDHASEFFD